MDEESSNGDGVNHGGNLGGINGQQTGEGATFSPVIRENNVENIVKEPGIEGYNEGARQFLKLKKRDGEGKNKGGGIANMGEAVQNRKGNLMFSKISHMVINEGIAGNKVCETGGKNSDDVSLEGHIGQVKVAQTWKRRARAAQHERTDLVSPISTGKRKGDMIQEDGKEEVRPKEGKIQMIMGMDLNSRMRRRTILMDREWRGLLHSPADWYDYIMLEL